MSDQVDAVRYRALRRMLSTPGLMQTIRRWVLFDGYGPPKAIDHYIDKRTEDIDR